MNAANNTAFKACAADVARALLGEPNSAESTKTELRWGNRGSFCLDLTKGTWFDNETGSGGGVIALVMHAKNVEKPEAVEWLTENGYLEKQDRQPRQKGKIVTTYDYRDEKGCLLFQVCRMAPKDFRQRSPTADGGWSWKTQGVRRVLFQLPDILAAVESRKTVFVVEGEKSALKMREIGLIATCSPGGAGKWKAEYSRSLTGATVIIIPDNDEPGRKHAEDVARSLNGRAESVRILKLPDLPPKGDVFDWISAGHGMDALIDLAFKAPVYEAVEPKAILRPEWRDDLMLDEKGNAIANVANVLTILRADESFSSSFALDEMACSTLLMKPLDPQAEPFTPRPITDQDVTEVQERIQRIALTRIGNDVMHQAIDRVAYERRFHPVRKYLSDLKWDGRERLSTWLEAYLGAEASEYVWGIGRMFLIAMVARIFEPGCKMDYMMVLQGPQGARKSSACAVLGDEWFSDGLPDLKTGKDVPMHLRGKWLIEVAELSAMGKADQETLKHFLTRRTERYRPPYGTREVTEHRQCVLIGTTNKDVFLTDETGGRRYWPVAVGHIDTDGLAEDRDQLFAEAVAAYRAKEKWWPDDRFEEQHIKPQQEAVFEQDAWEDLIVSHLVGQTKTTIQRVAYDALMFENKKIGTSEQRRIAKILERIGWERKRSLKERWWEKCK